jgi:hypothetical protein
MVSRKVWQALWVMAFVLGGAVAAPAENTPIPPSSPALRYVGRFDWRDPRGPRCAWAGSAVVVTFEGTGLDARIADTATEDFFEVIVDGRPTEVLWTTAGRERYRVVADLPRGRHAVELFKRTEPMVGTACFMGFVTDGRPLSAAPAPSRRIEIIGDSISCGYGDRAPSEKVHFSPRTEDNYAAYGAVAARALGADYACIAWSGRKMWPDFTLPEIYDRVLPADPTSVYAFDAPPPDVIVINLGTNDFHDGAPERERWIQACLAFLARVRGHAPKAEVFWAVGSMMSDQWPKGEHRLSTLRAYLEEAVRRSASARVHFLEFAVQQPSDGLGADWHPSVKTQEKMAAALVEAVRKTMGW